MRVLSRRNWDDLQIDLYVSLHVGFKIYFAGIVPVFLEFTETFIVPRSCHPYRDLTKNFKAMKTQTPDGINKGTYLVDFDNLTINLNDNLTIR